MISKDRWYNELSEKNRWDVMVAMRGPDSQFPNSNYVLKYFTTAVIRGEVWEILRCAGGSALYNTDDRYIILPDGDLYPPDLFDNNPEQSLQWRYGFNLDHFVKHIEKARVVLDIPTFYVPTHIWLIMMEHPGIKGAVKFLLSHKVSDQLHANLNRTLKRLRQGHDNE